MDQGYLKIILGCMYAGKTSKLINIYKMMEFSNIETCVINYEEDKRYDNKDLCTHDKVKIPCVQTLKLMDLLKNGTINSEFKRWTHAIARGSVSCFRKRASNGKESLLCN